MIFYHIINVLEGLAIHTDTCKDDSAAQTISNRPAKLAKDSDEQLSLILKWVQSCKDGHNLKRNYCQRLNSKSTKYVPPRLVEVRRDEVTGTQARLVELTESTPPYLALSYCWGEERYNHLTTTIDTYSKHCNSIPMLELPQTILDAITFTFKLGFHHIWIDSLCIIQDSKQDKLRQLPEMKSIFENAFLTIVAASAENASLGFLSMPDESKEICLGIPWDEDGSIFFYRGGPPSWSKQAINLRAWPLEERLLSPRKLIFLSDRVVWECRSLGLVEQGQCDSTSDDMRSRFLDGRSEYDEFGLLFVAHPAWIEVVQWYSRRKLTRHHDKLIAVAGLAEKYAYSFRLPYLAGIWGGILLVPGLLWRRTITEPGDELEERNCEERAPSWSWATIDGTVAIEQISHEEGSIEVTRLSHTQSIATLLKPDILSSNTDLYSSNLPYGRVRTGHIRGSFMLKRHEGIFTWSKRSQTREQVLLSEGVTSQFGSRDRFFCWPDTKNEMEAGSTSLTLIGLTGAAEDDDDEPDNEPTEALGRASTGISWRHSRAVHFVVRGIIVKSARPGVYTRSGYFELLSRDYDSCITGWDRVTAVLV